MFSRCLFITSSYSRRCLRTEKFCASTCFCARSIALRDHAVLDRHALFHAELLHQTRDAVRAEDAHQVVLEREIEAGGPGIALPAGTAAQLVVDAPRFVPLGADDVQAAALHDFVVLGVGQLLEVLEDALVRGPRHAIEAVQMEEVDELLVFDEAFLAFRQPFRDLFGKRAADGP